MKLLKDSEYKRLMEIKDEYRKLRQSINDVEEGQKVAFVSGHDVVIISEDYFEELVKGVVGNGNGRS